MKIVITSEKNSDKANLLAQKIITKKLGACVQCIPNIQSNYFWQNEIVNENECLLIIKTIEEKIEDLKNFITDNHSYAVPEIMLIDTESLNEEYSKWLQDYLS